MQLRTRPPVFRMPQLPTFGCCRQPTAVGAEEDIGLAAYRQLGNPRTTARVIYRCPTTVPTSESHPTAVRAERNHPRIDLRTQQHRITRRRESLDLPTFSALNNQEIGRSCHGKFQIDRWSAEFFRRTKTPSEHVGRGRRRNCFHSGPPMLRPPKNPALAMSNEASIGGKTSETKAS